MKVNKKKTIGAFIAITTLAASLFASAAQGAIITQTQDFTPLNQLQEVPYIAGLNFNKFDPSLGTLNSIGMTINTTFDASVAIINMTPSSQPVYNAFATIPITISGPNANYTVNVSAGPFNPTVPSYLSTATIYTYAGTPVTFNNSFTLPVGPSYQGLGAIPFTYALSDGVGTYGGSSAPWVFFGGLPTAKGDVTLTYDYTPVPEPSTYLAGLGALCLFGFTAIPKRKTV